MKNKLLFILVAIMSLPILSIAQGTIAQIWTEPAVFNADEQISIYFDLTGTELASVAEEEGVCIWTWFPGDPGETWGAPSDASKLAQVEGNIWKWVLTPTEFYGKPADQIAEFYGQLQTHSGEKITIFAPDQDPPNHILMYGLTTIKSDATILDYHPKQFSLDKPLSVLLNANNAYPDNCDNNPVVGDFANAPNVHVHSGVNDWAIVIENNQANIDKTELTHLGDGIYRWDFIPNEYFGLEEGFPVLNIGAVFASNDWSYIGKNVNCTDFFIEAPAVTEVAIPELTFFPSKISKKDLLCIIRTENEVFVSSLEYVITAGSKTIKGSFSGNKAEMTAYINLVDKLKDAGDIDKINVVIKDNTGRLISENSISLVQLTD
ncbi:MAG: hypothetical protein PF541_08930 [Prolixibacteraceae bacterium]|jgi:hypothetical protein|nr:hypothetical protein [Prolixibacteraceae bacterium]